jgi:dihydrofolate reductase
MRKLMVVNYLTLDGVMQGPGHLDEDRSGGFEHGGWVTQYLDEEWGRLAAEGIAATDALLFGRKTYEKMAAYWPHQSDDDPIAATMNHFTKYVASKTLDEVPWRNSMLIKGDVVDEIAQLKEQPGKNIAILGSGDLLQTMMRHNLVDEYQLLVCPLVLGDGKRLFRDGGPKTSLKLLDSRTLSSGAVILTYRPE